MGESPGAGKWRPTPRFCVLLQGWCWGWRSGWTSLLLWQTCFSVPWQELLSPAPADEQWEIKARPGWADKTRWGQHIPVGCGWPWLSLQEELIPGIGRGPLLAGCCTPPPFSLCTAPVSVCPSWHHPDPICCSLRGWGGSFWWPSHRQCRCSCPTNGFLVLIQDGTGHG